MWFLHDGALGFPSDTVCKKGARRIKNPADDPTSTIHPTLTDHSAGRLPSLSALRQITGTRRRWPSYVLNQISLSLLVTCQTSKPFKAASGACWGGGGVLLFHQAQIFTHRRGGMLRHLLIQFVFIVGGNQGRLVQPQSDFLLPIKELKANIFI